MIFYEFQLINNALLQVIVIKHIIFPLPCLKEFGLFATSIVCIIHICKHILYPIDVFIPPFINWTFEWLKWRFHLLLPFLAWKNIPTTCKLKNPSPYNIHLIGTHGWKLKFSPIHFRMLSLCPPLVGWHRTSCKPRTNMNVFRISTLLNVYHICFTFSML